MPIVDAISQLFLHLEGRNQPMHVGGLQLFELPEDAGPDYVRRLVDRVRGFTTVDAPFNQCLVHHLGAPFWRTDNDLDLDFHVRHLALPEPGAIRDLLALVSMLHGALLDRARPLWEMYVIEGVTERRFALYIKFHHAMMDGVSAMRLIRGFLGEQPDAAALHVPWSFPSRGSGTRGSRSALGHARASLNAATRQLAALPGAAGELYTSWQDARQDPDFTGPMGAPASMFNRSISGSRRVAAQSYALDRIRRIGEAFDATVNDVVLAMCAYALRQYLIDNQALPERPLIALVPVSLHDEAGETGNRVGVFYVNLATDVADPVDRLAAIQRSVAYWKRRYKSLSSEQILALAGSLSAPAGLNLLTGIAPRHQGFNVVISNIPGPDKPLYFGDARMQGMYPLSIVLDGQALNISLTSYDDALEFGLTACRRSVPSMQNLLKYLGEALDALESGPAVASA